MYSLTDQDIDFAREVEAIAQYLTAHWTASVPWQAIAEHALSAARHDARCWFEEARLDTFAREVHDLRKRVINAALPADQALHAIYFDAIGRAADELSSQSRVLAWAGINVDGAWNFGRNSLAIHTEALRLAPSLRYARPNGWLELATGGAEQEEASGYCTQSAAEFCGADTEGAGTPSFIYRVELSQVRFDDVDQGRAPPYTVSSAIYGHFLRLVQHQNTNDVLRDLGALRTLAEDEPLRFELPEAFAASEAMHAISQAFILGAQQAIVATPYTQSDLDGTLQRMRAHEKLSEAEKFRRAEQAKERMLEELLVDMKGDSERLEVERNAARNLLNSLGGQSEAEISRMRPRSA